MSSVPQPRDNECGAKPVTRVASRGSPVAGRPLRLGERQQTRSPSWLPSRTKRRSRSPALRLERYRRAPIESVFSRCSRVIVWPGRCLKGSRTRGWAASAFVSRREQLQKGRCTVPRRIVVTAVASAVLCLGVGAASAAASPVRLRLSESGAFHVLGHWCGGISQKVYATGFASNGFPTGGEYLSTTWSRGGRGRKPVQYTAWASSVWDWYGDTRSYAAISKAPEGISETFSAEDSHGDHIYNVGTSAYLEAPSPPIQAPAAPTNVTAYVSEVEVGEKVELRLQVGWTPASETASLLTSSHVVATPVGSKAPVLEATVHGGGAYALLAPLERRTTYQITVTNTDPEGTSQPSTPIEVNSISPEEEREKKEEEAEPKPPEFGRCVKAASEKVGKTTYYRSGEP